jgi:hypothetical protein
VNDAVIHLHLLNGEPVRIPTSVYQPWKWFRSATVPPSKHWAYKSDVWYLPIIFSVPLWITFRQDCRRGRSLCTSSMKTNEYRILGTNAYMMSKTRPLDGFSLSFALRRKFLPSKQKKIIDGNSSRPSDRLQHKLMFQSAFIFQDTFPTTSKRNNFCVYPCGKNEISFVAWRNSSSYDVCKTQHSSSMPYSSRIWQLVVLVLVLHPQSPGCKSSCL